MKPLATASFLQGLPEIVRPQLPKHLQQFEFRVLFRTLLQIHFGEPALHYEVSHVPPRPGITSLGWELGFHCESRDHHLNRLLLLGFRRHLFEIKSVLGEQVEAEMWDRGWTKIYEVWSDEPLSTEYQSKLGSRLAAFITCIHPIFVDLRGTVAEVYR